MLGWRDPLNTSKCTHSPQDAFVPINTKQNFALLYHPFRFEYLNTGPPPISTPRNLKPNRYVLVLDFSVLFNHLAASTHDYCFGADFEVMRLLAEVFEGYCVIIRITSLRPRSRHGRLSIPHFICDYSRKITTGGMGGRVPWSRIIIPQSSR
jgi:hypothetical protein